MEDKLNTLQFTLNTLPMNDRQLEGFLKVTQALQTDPEHELILQMPNNDDPQKIWIRWNDNGYFVGFSFPMDDFGWSHPLVLGAEGLEYEDVEMLITEICVNQTETEKIDLVMHEFRDVTGQVYGDERGGETE